MVIFVGCKFVVGCEVRGGLMGVRRAGLPTG